LTARYRIVRTGSAIVPGGNRHRPSVGTRWIALRHPPAGISRPGNAPTHSISVENPFGAKGQGCRAIEGTGATAARHQHWCIEHRRLGQYRRAGSRSACLADRASHRRHIPDPTRSQENLHVTIHALSWRSPLGGFRRYLPLQDDIASTAFWYQAEPHAPFPEFPGLNDLEVV
jgi:hypothetical protein